MAKLFVSGKLSAIQFVDDYMDMHDNSPFGKEKVTISDDDFVKDPCLLSSIYLHCDTHESMNVNNPYTDDELKEVVKIFLLANSVDDGYKEITEKGLLK
ncbi:colicin immunity domain-containing protein [Pasteurella atlantica]|uniref:Colicin immunity domain-containing protein n=2 Tax=Pasteurellales TaxID=135625 RepID=A0AAW8CQB0_9PAST|nr:colicin immunity domain-containing protein [Pasteurella atlantica]MDP8042271.1 colicin immunity domain-containing protein [Pasteurella atlantica]MDP8046434.1 colicin immunity domain-containing protein [Pasteurella atlantica]MDP8123326.1 colicin immunity domain-containing protein [Pasteurella atlantica]MDP8135134.1 colicin immunity domain-containing protein [Pasteurella atlantica]MDP8143079.1 colicin immunity domain-containing protein [Pasteurella atlantica]